MLRPQEHARFPSPNNKGFFSKFTLEDAAEYAACVGSCAANMFTGRGCAHPMSASDRREVLGEAIQRVRDDSFFVGLAERWNESVRLFAQLTKTSVVPSDYQPAT